MDSNIEWREVLDALDAEFRLMLGRQWETLTRRATTVAASAVELCLPEGPIHFLPVRAFRRAELFLPQASPGDRIFLSSGSTGSPRARHRFTQASLARYAQASTTEWQTLFARWHVDEEVDWPLISLVPPPALWPDSSLSFMLDALAKGGVPVLWCDVEAEGTQALDAVLAEPRCARGAVVFGTSFHHALISAAKKPERARARLAVDTGGMKGKAQSLAPEEMRALLQAAYPQALHASEYGMCELASQAWSAQLPHDGSFRCAAGMRVVAVALEENGARVCAPGESGFLAFLDPRNTDSYAAVLTEDRGRCLDQSCFVLEGRAPDATLKGCSLNVKAHALLGRPPALAQAQVSLAHAESAMRGRRDCGPSAPWSARQRADLARLRETLLRVPEEARTAREHLRPDWPRDWVFIAAANIPISWLAPAAALAALGARSLSLVLPSMRADDPLAGIVRAQITELAPAEAPLVAPSLQISLSPQKEFPRPQDGAPVGVIAFGSDDSVAALRSLYGNSAAAFLGFGNVRNAWMHGTGDPTPLEESLATAASAWLGRGCLTPQLAFLQETSACDALALAESLDALLGGELHELGVDAGLYHTFDALELRALARTRFPRGARPSFVRRGAAGVLDLRPLANEDASVVGERVGPYLDALGQGYIALAPAAWLRAGRCPLGSFSVFPSAEESAWEHMGRAWLEILANNQ